MNYLLLVIGFALLIKGADYFVDGASNIAKKLKVPSMIIGLTIVAFGTSAPEAAVSINSAIQGSSDIAIGNIVGSNIFNGLFVLGVAAIISPININTNTLLKEFPLLLLSTIALYILGNDILFQESTVNLLTTGDGLILFCIFAVFLYYLIESSITSKETDLDDELGEKERKEINLIKSITLGALGLGGILLGADLVVKNSTEIALGLGMSETLIGLTIISIGTSLPELVTSLVASYKGEGDIAVGNVVGSNLFNILFILGTTSIINTMTVDSKILIDTFFLLLISILTYLLAISKRKISKGEGIMLSALYIIYTIYIIGRN